MGKVTTVSCSVLSEGEVVFNGRCNVKPSDGQSVQYGFEYSYIDLTANALTVFYDGSASEYSCNVASLWPNTLYYYRAFVQCDGQRSYGKAKSFMTGDYMPVVDLGLSVKWAAINLGATKPEENGDYYAWGESDTKHEYSWETYKWCNGTALSLTKYNNPFGVLDSAEIPLDFKTELESGDDVAHLTLGGKWKMPGKEDFGELVDNCYSEYVFLNGTHGKRLTSRVNGQSIFFPFAGIRQGEELERLGETGYYWCSECLDLRPDNGIAQCFMVDRMPSGGISRSYGLSIRPVLEK